MVRDRGRSRSGRISDPIREALWPAEVLAYVADDVSRFGSATDVDRCNIYAAFIDVYGDCAPERLHAEVAASTPSSSFRRPWPARSSRSSGLYVDGTPAGRARDQERTVND